MIEYKGFPKIDKKIVLLGQRADNDSKQESYQTFFGDLFDDDHNLVLNAIINLSNIADIDINIFKDCVAFTKVIEISNNPIFVDYIVVLHFFDKIVSNSIHDEQFLARFISKSFLLLLQNFLMTNFENPDLFRLLFNIYSNIIYCSNFYAEKILTPQFLSRLYEIVEHLPKTSDYFLDLLGCILLRFKILMNFPIDPFPKIIEIIRFFFESPDFILFSNVFSTLAQASSIEFPSFIKMFFVPFIIEKTSEILGWKTEINEENTIHIGLYTINVQSLFTLKRDALSIILNFSAIDEETRSQLIDVGLIDLNCNDLCFLQRSNHDKTDTCNDFFETQDKQEILLIKNNFDSSLLPKIAANFFTDKHSNAIIFAYSTFWKSLLNNYEWFNFDTKQEIARAATLALSCHDEDLITTILSDDIICNVMLALTECFLNNDIKLEMDLIQAIDNLIDLFYEHPKIKEINLAFKNMIYSEFVNEIKEFFFNEENEISSSLYPTIEKILSFFNEYSTEILALTRNSDDGDIQSDNDIIDDSE